MVTTFEKHRQEPDKSLEEYTKSVRLQLGQDIQNCRKIYLDTNYWIELRDGILGRQKNNDYVKLLNLLRQAVAAEKLLCPISDENFNEILQQSDPTTLKASAKLIDELSN